MEAATPLVINKDTKVIITRFELSDEFLISQVK